MHTRDIGAQGKLDRRLQDASAAWRRRDFAEGIALMERASRADPDNGAILLALGRMRGLRYQFASAERCLDKAVRVAQRQTATLAAAAQIASEFGDYAMAERFYVRALGRDDAPPDLCIELATICERQSRLDAAAELVERALARDADCSVALLARARLDRHAGRLEDAERRLRALVARPERDVWTHAQAWYELGAVLDRQQSYGEAMAAFVAAKELLRPQAVQALAGARYVRSRLDRMRTGLSSQTLRRWQETGAALQPARRLALLGGHPRSGTTLLEQVLDGHPDIVSIEETGIFRDDASVPFRNRSEEGEPALAVLDATPINSLRQSRTGYFLAAEAVLRAPIGNRLLLDKNPSLTALIPALVRVFPEIKLLIALRDPRDVCLSCFMQPLRPTRAASSYLTLEDTVDEYTSLMGMWTTLAPLLPVPFLEVRYEDAVDDLEAVARRVLEFLGAPWDARVLQFAEHARGKFVRAPTYGDVVRPLYRHALGRWRNYEKFLEPHLARLLPFAKAFGYE